MRVAPNDFTGILTYDLLEPFVDKLLFNSWTTLYGGDLVLQMENFQRREDPEGPWALQDITEGDLHSHSERKMSLVPPVTPDSPRFPGRKYSLAPSLSSVGESSANPSALGSVFSKKASTATDTSLSQESSPPMPHKELLRSEPVVKKRNQMLCQISDELLATTDFEIAQQITRCSWRIFKTISPRDLVRHVMAPRDLSNPVNGFFQSAANPVARSIAMVNFLSSWYV